MSWKSCPQRTRIRAQVHMYRPSASTTLPISHSQLPHPKRHTRFSKVYAHYTIELWARTGCLTLAQIIATLETAPSCREVSQPTHTSDSPSLTAPWVRVPQGMWATKCWEVEYLRGQLYQQCMCVHTPLHKCASMQCRLTLNQTTCTHKNCNYPRKVSLKVQQL